MIKSMKTTSPKSPKHVRDFLEGLGLFCPKSPKRVPNSLGTSKMLKRLHNFKYLQIESQASPKPESPRVPSPKPLPPLGEGWGLGLVVGWVRLACGNGARNGCGKRMF